MSLPMKWCSPKGRAATLAPPYRCDHRVIGQARPTDGRAHAGVDQYMLFGNASLDKAAQPAAPPGCAGFLRTRRHVPDAVHFQLAQRVDTLVAKPSAASRGLLQSRRPTPGGPLRSETDAFWVSSRSRTLQTKRRGVAWGLDVLETAWPADNASRASFLQRLQRGRKGKGRDLLRADSE